MEIKINDIQWHGRSQSERDKITQNVANHFKGVTIVPDSATPPIDLGVMTTQGLLSLPKPYCEAICNIVQAAAIAACAGAGGPVAVAACAAVAQAAGDACRKSC